MLPFFQESGHNLFAKSAHVFYQEMKDLQSIMDSMEFQNLTSRSYFTLRISNKFWVGVWYMTIEQVLMRSLRSMKCVGGLTHGCGLTESVITKGISCTMTMTEAIIWKLFAEYLFLHQNNTLTLESPEYHEIPVT